jgi:alpha,alpha-trehalase
MSSTPIADLALLSDRRSSALVDRGGRVVWLSFPRHDSPSVLGHLLDERAGHWLIRPEDDEGWTSSRRYLDRSLVLQTRWDGPDATLIVTDALCFGETDDPHALGIDAPHLLVRSMRCTRGTVEVTVRFAPAPEYGLVRPLLSLRPDGVLTSGGGEQYRLCGPVPFKPGPDGVQARITLHEGEQVLLGLQFGTQEHAPRGWTQDELRRQLDATVAAWQRWSDLHQRYTGPWADLVQHSGRVLFGLSYAPTGAIVAAASTSLPEEVGGERNWDYRYTWVRDASFTMEALWVAACPDEAADFFTFLARSAAGAVGPGIPLQIMFGIGGEHDLTERTLPHLAGWHGSRPVRVGNGAWNQRQVDVYGELLGAAHQLRDQLAVGLDPDVAGFLAACADTAATAWMEPDQGIWEIRGDPQHFLYSKLMCWVALDRAIRMADLLGVDDSRVAGWVSARDEVRRAVLDRGWSEQAKAFTQHEATTELDASALMLPIVGLLPADDPRVLSTIDRVQDQLTGWCTGTVLSPASTAWPGTRAPSCCAPSGWPRPSPSPARWNARPQCSSPPPGSPTTSACSPKRWTARPVSYSATSRRRSATSAWSTPPGRSPRPRRRHWSQFARNGQRSPDTQY